MIKKDMKNQAASELAKLRWSKEVPDPEHFSKLGKLSVKKRRAKKRKKLLTVRKVDNLKKE